MHLLAVQAGAVQQDGEAIDLGQSPGRIVFASAADSEISALAAAVDRAGRTDLRLANLMRLSHNMSVDLWVDKTVSGAKLIVLRLLGGMPYWPYGVAELERVASAHGISLVLLPGDDVPDPALKERSTVEDDVWHLLHGLFVAGGPDNMDRALTVFENLAQGIDPEPLSASAFPRFGLWWPGEGIIDFDRLASLHGAEAEKPVRSVPILFYRAALEGAGTAVINRLVRQLLRVGLGPVPLVVSSLKEGACVRYVRGAFERFVPEVIVNATGFALGLNGIAQKQNPFADIDAPVIQILQSGRAQEIWEADSQGLSAKDLAMQVVMPELDGRIGFLLAGHKAEAQWHEATECALSAYVPDGHGITQIAEFATNWTRLRRSEISSRRIGLVLANYPIRDGRLANGVGYDAPQSSVEIMKSLAAAGYHIDKLPENGNALIERLQKGPTNVDPGRGVSDAILPVGDYLRLAETYLGAELVNSCETSWGVPEVDPFCRDGVFHLPVVLFGNLAVMLQLSRGYDRDAAVDYHDPALVPPHAYLASYLWMRHVFDAHAIVHNGKHGNLEWLPGKAVAQGRESYPLALWGRLPQLYPFIVNDPGEGTQAKRRTGAVIIDHLVPPLTRAESYGPLKDLEALLDEYYAASGLDRRRLAGLKKRILDLSDDMRLSADIGAVKTSGEDALGVIDNYLCELKEAQIRDGLHIFGQSPKGRMRTDLVVALARIPRGERAGDQSLIRALADDLRLGFDPLTVRLSDAYGGPALKEWSGDGRTIRSCGDVVEWLEEVAARLVGGAQGGPGAASSAVLKEIREVIAPRVDASGPAERQGMLDGLSGRFIQPGPSGAPSRGRLDVLPTGRNFYSVDNRAVPTPTAWELGQRSAEALLLRHYQDHGTSLKALALSAWGTSNMRTGGDDIAQALALIGVKPVWDPGSLRVSGHEIIPLAKLGRPRVDVTLRISGFFRDAFPQLIDLFDRAIRAIGSLDEPEEDNPIAARMRTDALGLMQSGLSEGEAALKAGHRIFGSKPGAYGAGLQALIDSGNWRGKADLAESFVAWGQYAYGVKSRGVAEPDRFRARLGAIEAVVHNQDNREHDLLDSDDYYQFEGGLSVAAEQASGTRPAIYHTDHSRPERVRIRTLEEEIGFVVRSRVVNPKWISGVKRHGYKGAFEIIATVDYLFAFAATTGAVKSHHFDMAFEAFVEDDETRAFIKSNNRHGFEELMAKFREAMARGFWVPRSNSVHAALGEA